MCVTALSRQWSNDIPLGRACWLGDTRPMVIPAVHRGGPSRRNTVPQHHVAIRIARSRPTWPPLTVPSAPMPLFAPCV